MDCWSDPITVDVINGMRYYFFRLIKSFKDDETRNIFNRIFVRRFSYDLQRAARRKLLLLDAAEKLNDLNIPPGNRLEALKGNRKGQHSIRINDQWRICFRWIGSDAENVEITDYH
jgi:proteic killer suppression protein